MAVTEQQATIEQEAQHAQQPSKLVTLQNRISAAGAPHPTVSAGKVAHIDLAQMQEVGIATPLGGRGRVFDEYRLIKRPVLQSAAPSPDTEEKRRNLVMVTSAQAGEGKTFTAISLAMSVIAEEKTPVLLVDLDIARQDLCRRLGISSEIGLINLLNETAPSLSEVIVQTDVPRLTVLPAGADHPLAHELLAGPKMRNLANYLSRLYRHGLVIFDVAPVLVSADTSVLATNVGQVIMVIEANRTGRASVEEAISLLDGCKQISFVLNKVEASELISQYGSYYGHYDGVTSRVGASFLDRIRPYIGKRLFLSQKPE